MITDIDRTKKIIGTILRNVHHPVAVTSLQKEVEDESLFLAEHFFTYALLEMMKENIIKYNQKPGIYICLIDESF
jgi:hypothetical protein